MDWDGPNSRECWEAAVNFDDPGPLKSCENYLLVLAKIKSFIYPETKLRTVPNTNPKIKGDGKYDDQKLKLLLKLNLDPKYITDQKISKTAENIKTMIDIGEVNIIHTLFNDPTKVINTQFSFIFL